MLVMLGPMPPLPLAPWQPAQLAAKIGLPSAAGVAVPVGAPASAPLVVALTLGSGAAEVGSPGVVGLVGGTATRDRGDHEQQHAGQHAGSDDAPHPGSLPQRLAEVFPPRGSTQACAISGAGTSPRRFSKSS